MNGIDGGADHRDPARRRAVLFVHIQPGDVDEILRALSRRRRRYVMYHLQEHETSTLETLAGHVAAAEEDVSVADVSDERRETVAIELRHTHLPQLSQAGLVDYDPRTGDVRYAHPPTILDALLEACAEIERSDTVLG